jgi:protein arginine N-methyltransferase 1
MAPLFDASLRKLLRLVKDRLQRTRIVQHLAYDRKNQATFTGLEWHEKMLADSVRVQSYRKGIGSAVKPGDVVVDLGTGTGILAMFAAAAGAKRVYAIDHSDFIRVAAEIARRNGFDNIRFVQKNSRDFACPVPVDLIVHEQMGHTIFGEHMIRNLLDLKQRTLKPGGRILPARFELLAAPVSLKAEYRRPFLWDIDDVGIDLSFLRTYEGIDRYRSPEHRRRLLKGFEVESFLARPKTLIAFDMNRIEGEDDLDARHTVTWEIDTNCVLDGICFHFRVEFDDGTTFDTSPFSPQTNWENLLLRTARTPLAAGSELTRSVELSPLTNWGLWRVLEPLEPAGSGPTQSGLELANNGS